jgi:outer membrane protein assembly factor BamB
MELNIENRLKLSKNIAIVVGIFCLAVALVLLLNYLQISKKDPLENEAMKVLVQRLTQNPQDDALKNDIRNLDLLARKAWFNSKWQIKTGSILLLIGSVIFALALRVYYSILSRIEIPDQTTENEWKARILSQKWIIISGVGFLLLSLAASFASVDYLQKYSTTSEADSRQKDSAVPGIEVVEVKKESVAVSDSTANLVNSVKNSTSQSVSDSVKNAVEVKTPDASQIMANSPSFRGPFGNGISSRKNIPADFDGASGKNILWKISIPLAGTNSPIIWGDKLFVSGANAQKREMYCFDRNTGKLLWTVVADNIQGSPPASPKTTEDTGLAAPTLTTDGNYVFGIFGNGDIIATDMNGTRIWARNLGVPDNHYGHSSSLIVWKKTLFVQFDTNKSKKLIGINTSSGETRWETNRNVKISWSSPILANIGGRIQVILAADPLVAGYDPDSGKELWTCNCLSGEVGPSPAFGEGLVFTVNEYAKLAAVNPATAQIVWEADEYLSEVSSPVVSGGLLFEATSYGILVCYDAKTGAKVWEHDSGKSYYSSPVVSEGKLFIFDTDGRLQVFAVSREKAMLAESQLGAKVTSTPAFANNRMYVRAGTTLFCIGSK